MRSRSPSLQGGTWLLNCLRVLPSKPFPQSGRSMSKPDPLIIQAVREAAESFNDLLQVIVLESHAMANQDKLDEETAARVARIAKAARAAVDLSR